MIKSIVSGTIILLLSSGFAFGLSASDYENQSKDSSDSSVAYKQSDSQNNNDSINSPTSQGKTVTVRAEGSGTTKIEALKNAWMEAVRKGVGMFMTAKSEALDDKLTEQVVIHSRGQVNSYKLVSENQDNGLWNVVIDANIDKDILQETAASSQSIDLTFDGSKDLAFDGSNDAAKNISTNEKEKSKKEVLESAFEIIDITKLLSYNAKLGTDINNGKKRYYITNEIKFDLKNFLIQAKEFEKIISLIAKSKYEIEFDTQNTSKYIKLLKLSTCPSVPPIDKSFTGNCGEANICIQYKPNNIKYRSICVFKNAAQMTCYEFDNEIYEPLTKQLYKEYNIHFIAETNDELIPVLAKKSVYVSFPYLFSPKLSKAFLLILPEFADPKVGIIQYNLPLELDNEQLVNIKSIRGKYTIAPLE